MRQVNDNAPQKGDKTEVPEDQKIQEAAQATPLYKNGRPRRRKFRPGRGLGLSNTEKKCQQQESSLGQQQDGTKECQQQESNRAQ